MNASFTNRNTDRHLWTISYFIGAIGLLWAFVGLSEFYNIQIADEGSAYPFGPINDNPWYYKDASIYATYNLISGLLFLAASLLAITFGIKRIKIFTILGSCLLIVLFIFELVSRNIQ